MTRGLALLALKLVVSVALLTWLLTRFDIGAAFTHIVGMDRRLVAAAFAVLLLHGVLSAWRWRTIVFLQGGDLEWRNALRLFFIAMFFNQTLSTTIGGDAARIWLVRAKGISVGAATAGVILERAAGLLALAALVPFGLAVAPDSGRAALLALLALALGVGLVILCSRRLAVARTARRVLLSAAALPVLGQSLAIHLGAGMAVYLLARAAGASPGLLVCLTLAPPVLLLATIPVSFGGWGVREAALVGLFAPFGVAADAALAVSIALGLLVMAAGLPGGVLWVMSLFGRSARAASTARDRTAPPLRPDAAPPGAAARPATGSRRRA